MPAKTAIPEVQEFRLELLDERQEVPEDEKTTVLIRQARVAQNAKRSILFSKYTRRLADPDIQGDKDEMVYNLPLYDLISEEVYLTLVGCNMLNHEGKEPLFAFGQSDRGPYMQMSKTAFIKAWGTLEDDDAAEIHSKVLEVNFHWKFAAEGIPSGE